MRQPHLNLKAEQQRKLGELSAQISCMVGGFAPTHHALGREVFDLGLKVLEARLSTGEATYGSDGYELLIGEAQAHASMPQAALSPLELEQVHATLRAALRPDAAA